MNQLNENTFVAIPHLALVQFGAKDDQSTATLRFLTGGTEILVGEAADRLRDSLSEIAQPGREPVVEESKHHESAVATKAESDPRHFKWVITSVDLQLGQKKGWHFKDDKFLAFVNAKGSCSLRSFNAEDGAFLNKIYRSGNYQEQFKGVIEDAIWLQNIEQPNLERDCAERLPARTLAQLKERLSKHPRYRESSDDKNE